MFSDEGSCDFPDDADCELTTAEAEALTLPEPTYIYLTFDDGPADGTPETLDALAAEDIRATFFVNMNPRQNRTGWSTDEGDTSLIRILTDGHVLADHSFDHMKHNTQVSGRGAYYNVDNDTTYFGAMNFVPVEQLMIENGFSSDEVAQVADTFFHFVRQPFTDNWRVAGVGRSDCLGCTNPPRSGVMGAKVTPDA